MRFYHRKWNSQYHGCPLVGNHLTGRLRKAHQPLSVHGKDSTVTREANAVAPIPRPRLVELPFFDFLRLLKLVFLGGFGLFLIALCCLKIHQ